MVDNSLYGTYSLRLFFLSPFFLCVCVCVYGSLEMEGHVAPLASTVRVIFFFRLHTVGTSHRPGMGNIYDWKRWLEKGEEGLCE